MSLNLEFPVERKIKIAFIKYIGIIQKGNIIFVFQVEKNT
jgi:hypothetical protein